jgi:hypothetical protein
VDDNTDEINNKQSHIRSNNVSSHSPSKSNARNNSGFLDDRINKYTAPTIDEIEDTYWKYVNGEKPGKFII